MAIMFEHFWGSFQALSLTKTRLTSLKISDYPGENVQALNLDIETYAMNLDCEEVFPDEILLEIYAIHKESSDLKFKLWAINAHRDCKK
eukprot:3244161-Ditylum_brightwellii.AAC.1